MEIQALKNAPVVSVVGGSSYSHDGLNHAAYTL
jgi:hypothetical protein